MARPNRRGEINGPFVFHRMAMRESVAWRSLPDLARRVLDRLEREHMGHGGTANGRLTCTYDDFEAAGIRRGSIAKAIRQAEALGFLEKTRVGYMAAGAKPVSNRYRLTYIAGRKPSPEPTDEWEAIKTVEDARFALALAARTRRYETQPSGRRRGPPRPAPLEV